MANQLSGLFPDREPFRIAYQPGQLKQRPGDQQLPEKNDLPAVQDLVVADIESRRRVGVSRYGTPLQPHNGRDSLRDLYEELLDGVCYIRQVIYERDHPRQPTI